MLAATALCLTCNETARIRYCFDETKLLRYDLCVEASLLPDIVFNARAELIWRCLGQASGEFDLEVSLRNLVVTRNQTPVRPETAGQDPTSIRFRMTERGEITVQETNSQAQNPAMMVLESLLDTVPRLPASPVGKYDSWVVQSRLAAAPLPQREGNQTLVKYECVVEKVPVLFGGVVLSLSSAFESDTTRNAADSLISGRGKGTIVLCPDDCTIKSLTHETQAVVTLPQHDDTKFGRRQVTYRMNLALNLINKVDVSQ